jgi:hypothetical protein
MDKQRSGMMNVKLNFSTKAMKGIERALLLVFGFLVVRQTNPEWLAGTEMLMPVALPLSTALYIVYTIITTAFMVIISILLLVFGLGGNSDNFIKSMLTGMTTESMEKCRIKFRLWVHVRSVLEDVLMVYFSWVLGKRYLAILMVLMAVESRWFYGVWNQLIDKMEVRFYADLKKETSEKEKA